MRDVKPDWKRLKLFTGVGLGLALTGCVAQGPATPSMLALPAPGESFPLFQQHDATCRAYASAQVGGETPGQANARSTAGGALLGTGIGAAAGALLGSASGHAGGGAAIGAGTGLLAGGLLGSAHGRDAAGSLQARYDQGYTQCMVANGERIAAPAAPVYAVEIAPPPVVYVPAPMPTPMTPYGARPVLPPPAIAYPSPN